MEVTFSAEKRSPKNGSKRGHDLKNRVIATLISFCSILRVKWRSPWIFTHFLPIYLLVDPKKKIINGDAWSRFFSRTFVIRNMGVSKNSGTPKSSILIRFSIINHPFWGTAIFGNIHMNSPKNHQGPRLWRGEWLCFFSQVLELGSPNHQWPEIPWFSWVCFRWFFPFYHDNHL